MFLPFIFVLPCANFFEHFGLKVGTPKKNPHNNAFFLSNPPQRVKINYCDHKRFLGQPVKFLCLALCPAPSSLTLLSARCLWVWLGTVWEIFCWWCESCGVILLPGFRQLKKKRLLVIFNGMFLSSKGHEPFKNLQLVCSFLRTESRVASVLWGTNVRKG